MAYRYDTDLSFLAECSNDELNDLVYCLTHDKDGKLRLTEELTLNTRYKRFYPEHSYYWKEIAAEIQCFGANSFVTIFRGGKGVLYREVLSDVCDKMKVNYNSNSSVENIENNLLMKLLTDSVDNMSEEEIRNLSSVIGVKDITRVTPQVLTAAFQTIFRLGGFKSYQLTVIIANAVFRALMGRGLTLATNAALTRVMGILTGPIGWTITSLWTLADISGSAYRVTIPAVIQVALLRKQQTAKIAGEISFG